MQAALQSINVRLHEMLITNYGSFRGWVRSLLGQLAYALGWIDPYTHWGDVRVERLVFVCLGNINRSAFAAAVARKRAIPSCSLGLSTTTGAPAFATAVVTARQFDIDLTDHQATDISEYEFRKGDLLIAMEIRHVKRLQVLGIPPASIVLLGHWSSPHRIHLHDPHTLPDAYFQTCFTLIHSAVSHLVAQLRATHGVAATS